MEQLLAMALQSGATNTGYNMDASRKYLKENAPDKRYQLYALSGTCSWGWNSSGTIQYKNTVFDYEQSETGFKVTRRHNYHGKLY